MGTKKESTAEEQEDAPNVFLIRSITIFQVKNLTHMTTKIMVVSWSYELVIHFKIASYFYSFSLIFFVFYCLKNAQIAMDAHFKVPALTMIQLEVMDH